MVRNFLRIFKHSKHKAELNLQTCIVVNIKKSMAFLLSCGKIIYEDNEKKIMARYKISFCFCFDLEINFVFA